jgi:hypothetical protein
MLNRHDDPPSPVRVYTLNEDALLDLAIVASSGVASAMPTSAVEPSVDVDGR